MLVHIIVRILEKVASLDSIPCKDGCPIRSRWFCANEWGTLNPYAGLTISFRAVSFSIKSSRTR